MIAGAIICSAQGAIALPTGQCGADSIADSIDLQEVEITVSPRIARADKNIIIPTAGAVERSSNGRDLIGRLNIPQVSVNPLTGEIGMNGGGKVMITVNGIAATPAETAAISPTDIIRVEYVRDPGPKYPDARMLINVVTKRHSSGGNVAADLMNAFKNGGECDLDNISASYSRGRSQWVYAGQLMRLKRDNWTRDYNEIRQYPTGALEIAEMGLPSVMELSDLSNSLSYSVADGNKYMVNARLGLNVNSVPHSEEADRTTIRETSDSDDATIIYEHMGERSLSPSLDLYGQYSLSAHSTVTANIVGTYISSDNTHTYRQYSLDENLTEAIDSKTKGRKYSVIAEAGYTYRSGFHRADAGIRHYQGLARNRYDGDITECVDLHQAVTAVYGRYAVDLGRVSLTAMAGITRFYTSQEGAIRRARYILTPSIGATWNALRHLTVSYTGHISGKMPALADLSDVTQPIDPDYYRRGNPGLKAYTALDQTICVSYQHNAVSATLTVPYTHEYRPIMERVIWENGAFVRVPANQKSFDHTGAELTVSLRPLRDHITLSLTPSIDHYASRGAGLNCSHTLKNLRIDLELNYGKWQLSYNTLTGYANYMYGTRLMKERNMSMIMAGYRGGWYTLKAGVLDPFIRKYWMETIDMSPLISSKSKAYSLSPTYVVIQANVNIGFGRRSEARHKTMENSDNESGLLKGTK